MQRLFCYRVSLRFVVLAMIAFLAATLLLSMALRQLIAPVGDAVIASVHKQQPKSDHLVASSLPPAK